MAAPATDPAAIDEGLRSRKKRERRALIAATAMRLFDEQGYAATTVAQIAREADVSPRTVSLYFPAKEDLVFAGSEETFERLEQQLASRAKHETFADGMRRWLATELEGWRAQSDELAIQRRLIEAEPSLQAAELRNRAHVHSAIVGAIAADFDTEPGGLDAQMAAAATIAIFEVIGTRLRGEKRSSAPERLDDSVLELFDRALVFVRAGMAALADEASAV